MVDFLHLSGSFGSVSVFFVLFLICTEVWSGRSGVPDLRGRPEGFPLRPLVGVSPDLVRHTKAPDTAVDLHAVVALSRRVLRSTLRVLTWVTGVLLRWDSVAAPVGSEGRCGAGAAASRGLSPSVLPQLTRSR